MSAECLEYESQALVMLERVKSYKDKSTICLFGNESNTEGSYSAKGRILTTTAPTDQSKYVDLKIMQGASQCFSELEMGIY